MIFFYIVRDFALSIIRIFELLLFARAIASWFPQVNSGQIGSFLYTSTEPLLIPVRRMFNKIDFFRNLPIDFSILGAFLILELVSAVLYMI